MHTGRLRVMVLHATTLQSVDGLEIRNPQVRLCVGNQRQCSSVQADALNPVWNEEAEFRVVLLPHQPIGPAGGTFQRAIGDLYVEVGDLVANDDIRDTSWGTTLSLTDLQYAVTERHVIPVGTKGHLFLELLAVDFGRPTGKAVAQADDWATGGLPVLPSKSENTTSNGGGVEGREGGGGVSLDRALPSLWATATCFEPGSHDYQFDRAGLTKDAIRIIKTHVERGAAESLATLTSGNVARDMRDALGNEPSETQAQEIADHVLGLWRRKNGLLTEKRSTLLRPLAGVPRTQHSKPLVTRHRTMELTAADVSASHTSAGVDEQARTLVDTMQRMVTSGKTPQVYQIRDLFDAIDADKRGYITVHECQRLSSAVDPLIDSPRGREGSAQKVVKQCSRTARDVLSFEEFHLFMLKMTQW